MTAKAPARPEDPRRLDLRGLARTGATLAGRQAQAALLRLAQSVEDAAQSPDVEWQAQGELRPVAGAPPQVWLHLSASTQVQLVCQRCLQPLVEPLSLERSFLFVEDEDEAARLDEEMDDDVLVLPRLFDALALLEDELILALPIVPRHEVCPDPLPVPTDDAAFDEAEDAAPHPFAALAALKKPGRPN